MQNSVNKMLLLLVIPLLSGYAWSLECKSERRHCCANYYMENGRCSECPAGTHGVNCGTTCEKNYYGRFCEQKCHCSDSQYCDSVNGCLQNKTYTTEKYGTSVWKNIVFASIGVITAGLAAVGVILLRSRLKNCPVQPFSRYSSDNAREDDRGVAFERCASEWGSEKWNNEYENSRELRSMYTGTENISTVLCVNAEHSIDNDVGVNYGLISKLPLKGVGLTDTNREGELLNHYEQPLHTSQYSTLSLKRNIDPCTMDLYV